MAEAVGDDKIVEMHESSHQLGEGEGSKDVGVMERDGDGCENGFEPGMDQVERVEKVYRYVKF